MHSIFRPFKRYVIGCLCLIAGMAASVQAQELNATVTFDVQQIEASYRDRFTTLQTDLAELINSQQWSDAQFANVEKIACTFAFQVIAIPSTDYYTASLTVQSRRPVYNSNYNSTTINFQDANVEFGYTEGQTLTFNEFSLDNELIAVTAYYIYLILGFDFDSFSENGGNAYFQKAENIVSQMQTSDSKGWKAFDSKKNRHAIVTALLDGRQSNFHSLWYNYHRLGLDVMYQSMDKGRSQITSTCEGMKELKSIDPSSVLLTMFIDAKIDELINIYSKAPQTEKDKVYNLLYEIYPTYKSRLNSIKEPWKEK